SMLTGLYPAEHGIHENARRLGDDKILLASRLQTLGYTTAAFVSGLPLASRFGLARGFDHYDDELGGAAERRAGVTTDRALAYLSRQKAPFFLWVHYFDPHEPYHPPEPFRSDYAADPYLGEVAYMDSQVGRLLAGFETQVGDGAWRLLVAGDHGEGRGDHGEALHGNLLYQGVLRVPLIAAGRGIEAGVRNEPVSVRRVFDTLSGWAGYPWADGDAPLDLLGDGSETVLAEAMKPYLQYGWQPQVVAIRDQLKVIQSGTIEVFDLQADPAEERNLAGEVEIGAELRDALRAYPVADAASAAAEPLSQADRQRLASLGYVDWQGQAAYREDAPSAKDMTHLFADLDHGSGLFVQQAYEQAIPVFARVLEQDPSNLMVAVRLAVAHSVTGRAKQAMAYFERARGIDPSSVDVRHYQGMHHFRAGQWAEAEALLGSVLAQMPDRLPALESLVQIRQRRGAIDSARELQEHVVALAPAAGQLTRLGELSMATGDTPAAIDAFERARAIQGNDFTHALELGVCYLANRQPAEAGESLDQVAESHPGYPMALFKRAQVAALLQEADRAERIRLAYARADATTRPLIENEALFRDVPLNR
ncbi:MAG: sulfatase-like hydrolase/transferase, partial [Acidobacteriota bacterium]